MSSSREETDSLKEKYRHLRRDWDYYMDSLPQRRPLRRRHSTADLTAATPDHLRLLLDTSPRKLVSSLQQPLPHPLRSGGRRLLDAFRKAEAASCPSGSSVSSTSTLDDGSSSSEFVGERDGDCMREEGVDDEWMVRIWWFAAAVLALALGFLSFGAEENGQCMTPT